MNNLTLDAARRRAGSRRSSAERRARRAGRHDGCHQRHRLRRAGQGLAGAQVQVINRTTGARAGAHPRRRPLLRRRRSKSADRTPSASAASASRRGTATTCCVSLGQNIRVDFDLTHAGRAARRRTDRRPRRRAPIISRRTRASATTITDSAIARLPTLNRNFTDFVGAHAADLDEGPGQLGRRPEQPLQRHPDRRLGRERSVRSRLDGSAGRTGERQADVARGGEGVPGAAVAVRRAPGQLHRLPRQRRDEERLERIPRSGTYGDAQREARAQRRVPAQRAVHADAGRLLDRRPDHPATSCSSPSLRSSSSRRRRRRGPYIGQPSTLTPTPPVDAAARRQLREHPDRRSTASPIRAPAVVTNDDNPLANMFARFDFVNLPFNSRLVARYNYVNAQQDVFSRERHAPQPRRTTATTSSRRHEQRARAAVLELRERRLERVAGRLHDDPRQARHADQRAVRRRSRARRIRHGGTGQLSAGTENSSQGNELDQDILELTDNYHDPVAVAPLHDRHEEQVLQGAQPVRAELARQLHVRHARFARATTRRARRRSASSSTTPTARRASTRAHSASTPRTNGRRANNLNLTMGLRSTCRASRRRPDLNHDHLRTRSAINTTNVPKNVMQWSPRVGFNWDVTGDRSTSSAAAPASSSASRRTCG